MRQVNCLTNLKGTMIAIVVGCVFMFSLELAGQSGGDYDVSRKTVDGGGGTSSGGDYVLTGTIGQPDAGSMASCDYHLSGGLWFEWPCTVDSYHFAEFSSQWLASGDVEANLDGQGNVDILDFHILASYWLCYCPGDWPWR